MAKKFTKEQIFDKIKEILEKDFEADSSAITKETGLFTDLDFDSIDAVDLAVRLQQFTNKKIKPEEFKQIKTINDVIEAVYSLID